MSYKSRQNNYKRNREHEEMSRVEIEANHNSKKPKKMFNTLYS